MNRERHGHAVTETRLRGAVWGHLVGDALGVPYEFRPPARIGDVYFGATGSHDQPAGTWSDDGGLMLALLDSLLEAGFDTADQGRRVLAWALGTAYTPDGDGRFDIGNATIRAVSALRSGVAAELAGPSDERALGNGSLMRILPIALVGIDTPRADLAQLARRASSVTHGHPLAREACAVYAVMVADVLAGVNVRDALGNGIAVSAASDDPVIGEARRRLLAGRAEARRGSGFVVDSFWSAVDAVLASSTYQQAVTVAVKLGDDTDTTAAIAGGLAGAAFGEAGIPMDWRGAMRGQAIVEPMLARLVATRRV